MMRRSCLLLVLAVLVGGGIAQAQVQSPAARLPGKTLAYLHWAGRSLPFDGSMFGQSLSDPSMVRMVGFFKAMTLEQAHAPAQQALLEKMWALADLVWQHPVTVAVLQIPDSDRAGELQLAMMIDLGKDREAFAKRLTPILQQAGIIEGGANGEPSYEQVTLPGAGPHSPIVMGYMGKTFYVAVGTGTAEVINKVDAADTLAGTTAHAEALAHVGGPAGEPLQMVYYIDAEQLNAHIDALTSDAAVREADIQKAAKARGMDKITAVAGSWRIADKGVLTTTWIKTPGPHKGLMSLFDGPPMTEADQAAIPADADIALAVNLDAKVLLKNFREAFATGNERASEDLEAGLAAFEKQFGLSLDEDVLAALGDTWTLSMADSQGGPLTGTLLSVEVRDEAKLNAAIEKLLPPIEQALKMAYVRRFGPWNMTPELMENVPSPIQSLQVGDAAIRYARIATSDDVASAILPAWCVHNRRLYVAPWPQTIASALQSKAKPLATHPEYKRLRAKLGEQPSWVLWTNTPQLMRKVYPLAVMLGTVSTNEILRELRTLQVPPLWPGGIDEMTKYTWPSITAIRTDEKGITFEGYSSHPDIVATSGGPLVLSMRILPELGAARHIAQQSVSVADLRTLATQTALYKFKHGGMPASVEGLISKGLMTSHSLVSPRSGRPIPQWDEETETLTGEMDYAMMDFSGLGDKGNSLPGGTLLAYERPDNYGPGEMIPVLMVDGHVEKVTRERLAGLIKEARDKGGKLPAWAAALEKKGAAEAAPAADE